MTVLWEPRQEEVAQVLQILSVLSNPAQTDQFTQATQAMEQFCTQHNPLFCQYLSYIMAHPLPQVSPHLRQLAGLVLKNQVHKTYPTLDKGVQALVKSSTLLAARDPEAAVHNTAGTVITTIIFRSRLREWPELVPCLTQMLDSADPAQIDGAFTALLRLCEDSAQQLDSESLGRPLNILIPKFLAFFHHQNERFRLRAIQCVNHLIYLMPQALLINMDTYLQGISGLATDSNTDIRRSVCQAIVMLMGASMESLMPNMASICEFMLQAQQDPEEEVAIEAGEFWSVWCGLDQALDLLHSYLPRLIPLLLRGMVWAPAEIAEFQAEDPNNEGVPDRPEDIRPMFHRSRQAAPAQAGEEEGEGENGGGDEGADMDRWSLRKCTAAALDEVSRTFGPRHVLPILLPALEERLGNPDVWVRECAVLALGAVANGCSDGVEEHLPTLLPFFLRQLSDPTPQMRSIACWTLSRFSRWIVQQRDEELFLRPVMEALLHRILDTNKKVQEAACSAFSLLEESAGRRLTPYLPAVLNTLTLAMHKYQVRSLIILYDTIGTLADAVGNVLAQPELAPILTPPLMRKFRETPDTDRVLFPLLECLTSVAQALGVAFQDHVQEAFSRCLRIMEHNLVTQAVYLTDRDNHEEPEMEFVVCSLDLLSGLAVGLGAGLEALVASSNLLALLYECMKNQDMAVRQSAFALVGDLAKGMAPRLAPVLPQYINVLSASLSPDYPSLCNNACWALGVVAIKSGGPVIQPFIPQVLAKLVPVLRENGSNQSLLENAAITLGRLALVCPDELAPLLDSFAADWFHGLSLTSNGEEKKEAFQGLCLLVDKHPAVLLHSIYPFCHAVASWHDEQYQDGEQGPPAELLAAFKTLLQRFKASLGDSWPQCLAGVSKDFARFLQMTYEI